MNNDPNKRSEDEKDLTKDAFFGDMMSMEKNIYDDALKLVEQAVSLVNSKLFDDAIEILRQAIGLFQQINKDMEIDALRNKIAEIYILKKEATQKEGISPGITENEKEGALLIKKVEPEIVKEEVNNGIPEQTKVNEPDKLINEAKSFLQANEFNKALDKYDEAIRYFKEIKNEPEIERVYGLIEECYVAKAEYLKKVKSVPIEKEKEIKVKDEKVEKIQEEPSGQEKAQIETENLEIEKGKLKSVGEHYKKEFEEEAFGENITHMADAASKLIHNYELEIKKGCFDSEPPYQKALDIYKNIRNQLLEKGWNDQADIYTNQINIVSNKLTQDLKLREIEAQKKEKGKVYLEHLKAKKIEEPDVEKLKAVEEKFKKEFEEDNFKKWVTDMADEANKLIRNYELEIKKGCFGFEPPYQKALDIYENVRNQLLEKDWNAQADIYTNQIKIIQHKESQDLKLREIEAQKKEKEKVYLEHLKAKKIEEPDVEKLKAVEEKVAKEVEDKKFGDTITKLIENADKSERDYETIKKKAIKEKKLLEIEAPFLKIIEIYEKIKNMLLEKGWHKQAEIHQKNISIYREKYERDKILRDIEAHKLKK